MNKAVCYFYCLPSGKSPVSEWLSSLDLRTRTKFSAIKDLLEEFGRDLREPYAKYVGDGIFELRFSGSEGAVRVLYFFFEGNKIIFTNGFIKKTDKLPQHEKQIAIQRKNSFLQGGKQP